MQIMGCLSFVQVLAVNQKTKQGTTPYDSLFDKYHERELRKVFVKEFCRVNKLSLESPLLKTIEAGTYAIPKLAKVRKIIKSNSKELPCEVNLGPNFQYHNVFICPVSKEATAASNNPQLLKCGHVVSKSALDRMCRGPRARFKCHTCPEQMTKDEVKEIKLYS